MKLILLVTFAILTLVAHGAQIMLCDGPICSEDASGCNTFSISDGECLEDPISGIGMQFVCTPRPTSVRTSQPIEAPAGTRAGQLHLTPNGNGTCHNSTFVVVELGIEDSCNTIVGNQSVQFTCGAGHRFGWLFASSLFCILVTVFM